MDREYTRSVDNLTNLVKWARRHLPDDTMTELEYNIFVLKLQKQYIFGEGQPAVQE